MLSDPGTCWRHGVSATLATPATRAKARRYLPWSHVDAGAPAQRRWGTQWGSLGSGQPAEAGEDTHASEGFLGQFATLSTQQPEHRVIPEDRATGENSGGPGCRRLVVTSPSPALSLSLWVSVSLCLHLFVSGLFLSLRESGKGSTHFPQITYPERLERGFRGVLEA